MFTEAESVVEPCMLRFAKAEGPRPQWAQVCSPLLMEADLRRNYTCHRLALHVTDSQALTAYGLKALPTSAWVARGS